MGNIENLYVGVGSVTIDGTSYKTHGGASISISTNFKELKVDDQGPPKEIYCLGRIARITVNICTTSAWDTFTDGNGYMTELYPDNTVSLTIGDITIDNCYIQNVQAVTTSNEIRIYTVTFMAYGTPGTGAISI